MADERVASEPIDAWSCGDHVDARVAALTEQATSICAAAMETHGCVPPAPFPEGAMRPDEVWASFQNTAAHCGVAPEHVAMDCSEYPCFLLVDVRSLTDRVTCPTLASMARHAVAEGGFTEEVAALAPGEHLWSGTPRVPPSDLELPGALAAAGQGKSRFEQRMQLTNASWLDTRGAALSRAPAPCDLRAAFAAMSPDDDDFCEAAMRSWGCVERDPAVFDAMVEAALVAVEGRTRPECSSIDLNDYIKLIYTEPYFPSSLGFLSVTFYLLNFILPTRTRIASTARSS